MSPLTRGPTIIIALSVKVLKHLPTDKFVIIVQASLSNIFGIHDITEELLKVMIRTINLRQTFHFCFKINCKNVALVEYG